MVGSPDGWAECAGRSVAGAGAADRRRRRVHCDIGTYSAWWADCLHLYCPLAGGFVVVSQPGNRHANHSKRRSCGFVGVARASAGGDKRPNELVGAHGWAKVAVPQQLEIARSATCQKGPALDGTYGRESRQGDAQRCVQGWRQVGSATFDRSDQQLLLRGVLDRSRITATLVL
jgi:hypothetical protein